MSRNPDVLFTAEYIKNVLYFATVRQGKVPKNTVDTHYFSIDNELVYENYYSDFGPLNLGCIYKYCKLLNEKLNQYLNKQIIIHYTSIDPKKKANAAFLLACYGVLYLSLSPRDALKPLLVHGQSYRPFQDATQGDSVYTISLMDCIQALKKARDLGFFNFQDFNYEEYERLDKIQGGDLNWIVPGKFLAFIGPVDYSMSLYHPPEMYIDYFVENNVKIVIRLNKRLYDGTVFTNVGIVHYDLFFPDGSCPPRHILFKFLQISEESEGSIAVHCKAGLGRTGSLIGCYLIKHYRMTSHEAIGWMRICRPGSVIGHQQGWLEQLESWLIKQGNIYRKRMYRDSEKLPTHEFGVYSFTEKNMRRRPTVLQKSLSPPPPLQRQSQSNDSTLLRPQASRVRGVINKATDKEKCCHVTTSIPNSEQKINQRRHQCETANISRRSSAAGEPRISCNPSLNSSSRVLPQKHSIKSNDIISVRNLTDYMPFKFEKSQVPLMKNVNDAKSFLMRSTVSKSEREKRLNSTIIITPQYSVRTPNYMNTPSGNTAHVTPSPFSTDSRRPAQIQKKRYLGRSPSPPQTRATNTPSPVGKFLVRETSKTTLKDVLSRLKLTAPRDGSVGAASLGARRDAPMPKRAPSARSDERPLATQGDLLNSIKIQRRLRDTLYSDKISDLFKYKTSPTPKDSGSIRIVNSRTNTYNKSSMVHVPDFRTPREKPNTNLKSFFNGNRPVSPKGRSAHTPSFY